MGFCFTFPTFLLVLNLQKTDCHAHKNVWEMYGLILCLSSPSRAA